MLLSDCCGAAPCNEWEEEGGICGECKEHCTYISDLGYDPESSRKDMERRIYDAANQEDKLESSGDIGYSLDVPRDTDT